MRSFRYKGRIGRPACPLQPSAHRAYPLTLHNTPFRCPSGDGLEKLQAIFDVAARPAWLKVRTEAARACFTSFDPAAVLTLAFLGSRAVQGIVCRFLVSEASQPHATEPVNGGCDGRMGGAGERGATAAACGSMAAHPEGPQERSEGKRLLNKGQPKGSWAATQPQKQPAVTAAVAVGAVTQRTAAGAAAAPQQPGGKGRKGRGHHGRQQREAQLSHGTSPAPSQEDLLPPPGLSPRAGSRASSCSFASCSSITPPLSPRAAVANGSRLGPADKQQQAQQQTGGPAAAAAPAACQGAPAGAAAVTGMAGTPSRRNRSRSRSQQGQRAGQEAGSVRRMSKLFPAAAEAPAQAGVAGPSMPSAEQVEVAAGSVATQAAGAADGGSAASSAVPIAAPPTARSRGRAGQRGERRGGRSTSSTPSSSSSPAPTGLLLASCSRSATPTGASPACAGLAAAAAAEQPATLVEQAVLQHLQSAGASPAQLERLQEANRLAADLLGGSELPQGPVSPFAMPPEAASQQPSTQRRPAAAAQPQRAPAMHPGQKAAMGSQHAPAAAPRHPAPAQPQRPAAMQPQKPAPVQRQPAPPPRQPAQPLQPAQAPVPPSAAAVQPPAPPKPPSGAPASRQGSAAAPVEPLAGQAVALVRPAPAAEDANQQLIAAVWQGAADAADLAAALAASSVEHSPAQHRGAGSASPPPSPPLCVERSAGSSSSMRSECSGSFSTSSSLSLSPECAFQRLAGNPSEFGLPYQFGCGPRLPPQHSAGGCGELGLPHATAVC